MTHRSPWFRALGTTLAACFAWQFPVTALAGGLEYTGQGTQSLGRGGAVAAYANDPMVIAHNPAGLADLRGNQMLLNLNIAVMDACVQPYGYYGWGAYLGGAPSRLPDPNTGEYQEIPLAEIDTSGPTPIARADDYYRDPYDRVCLSQAVTPVPQLVWSMRLSERLGIGFGIVTPAVQPSGHWGAHGTAVIRGDTGALRPAATRYQLMSSNNIGLFPNIGIGYRLTDFLRIGAALEYGFVTADNRTMAPTSGNTSPGSDIAVHIRATDYFIPAFTASVHLVPSDALDVVVAFRWQDGIDAAGTAKFTSGMFDPTKEINTSTVEVLSVRQNMPWKLRGGIRYASRRSPRPAGVEREVGSIEEAIIHDALQDERWDVELDVEYQFNSRNRSQFVDFVDGSRIDFKPAGSAMLPNDISVEKRWRDQWSVRLGGTVNAVPGVVGVSGGVHYETRGVDPAYMQVDFWPVARLGLHAGVTLRIARSVDLVVSYAHIFQETLVVAAPPHQPREVIYAEYQANDYDRGHVRANDKTVGVPTDRTGGGLVVLEEPRVENPDGTAALVQYATTTSMNQPPVITNQGRYRSSIDVVSLGTTFHF